MDQAEAWADVLANEGLVKWSVQRFLKTRRYDGIEFDDLLTAAYEACYRAALTWDPAKGTKGTFYSVAIRHALLDEVQSLRRGVATPTAGTFAFPTNTGDLEPLEGTEVGTHYSAHGPWAPMMPGLHEAMERLAEEQSFEDELIDRLDQPPSLMDKILELPKLQRAVVLGHVWAEKSFRELGAELGISGQAAFQAWERGLNTLRRQITDTEGVA